MFLEIILAGLVAWSAHSSADKASKRATDSVKGATEFLGGRLTTIEGKVDQLHIKIDTNQVRLMKALSWHDYIQTLHVKGATYQGDNLYTFREKRTRTIANLATKEVQEINGSFVLYKSFVDDTEKLYAKDILIYEKFANGEISVYDDKGRVYMHTDLNNDTYTYLPDGKTQSIKWRDGAVWIYKYDDKGIVIEVESYNMQPTSRKPPPSQAVIQKWRDCAVKHSVTACVKECNKHRTPPEKKWYDYGYHDNGCFSSCNSQQISACGHKPT